MPRPLRVALTGGIATGKSSCLRHFAAFSIPTIDADVLAREVVAPGSAALSAIARRFGSAVVRPDGLDRAALARVIFADPPARHDLEAIIHPLVYSAIQSWFAEGPPAAPDGPGLGIADIPLLFETAHEHDFDRVIVAACSPEEQRRRLIHRDHLSDAEATQRLSVQMPIEQKRAKADYVIDTSGTVEDTGRQIRDVVKRLGGVRDQQIEE